VPHRLLEIQCQRPKGPGTPTMAAGPEGCHIGFAARSLAKGKRPNVPKSANAFLTLGFRTTQSLVLTGAEPVNGVRYVSEHFLDRLFAVDFDE
jgi:hypothetical protein